LNKENIHALLLKKARSCGGYGGGGKGIHRADVFAGQQTPDQRLQIFLMAAS